MTMPVVIAVICSFFFLSVRYYAGFYFDAQK